MSKSFRLGKIRAHFHAINEKKSSAGHLSYLFAMRFYWHFYQEYPTVKGGQFVVAEKGIWSGHLEAYIYKRGKNYHRFSSRFHIGNEGSGTPWDGHLSIGPFAIYWGHSAFGRLASWLTRCSGYQWDTRDWMLQLTDEWRLRWQCANHSDMCDVHRKRRQERARNRGKKSHRIRSLREGYINLNISDHIWGPVRYSYEDVSSYQTLLRFPDGEYAVVLTLQKVFKGRTKVDRRKHEMSWSIDVDAPKGVPTHYDSSGGWKGDRSYGWSVAFPGDPKNANYSWEHIAQKAVEDWVLNQRARTGFTEPQKEDV